MGKRSTEVDRYIEKAAPFARPILERIRAAFHAGAPGVQEVMKWSTPHFEQAGLLAGMAAFKEHVSWGFWKGQLLNSPAAGPAWRTKVRTAEELPPKKELVAAVREAVRLNEEGVKVARAPRKRAVLPKVPADLEAALRKNKRARQTFNELSPSHRREYLEWITEARRESTRQKRLATTLEWLAEGKPRNWKYRKP